MTDSDERLLTAAKLREQIDGRLDSRADFYTHTGIVDDDGHRSTLSFVESVIRDSADHASFAETELGSDVLAAFRSDRATTAVSESNGSVLSHLVGVTEQDLDASAITLSARILEELDRDGALSTILAAGDPNTGKTNTAWLLVELARTLWDDLLVLSNAAGSLTDIRVTSMHELTELLIEHRERPKAVLLDECSTHMDARTHSREVATQWTPVAKRMAKLGVDVQLNVVHSGKDYHPEGKRLTTLGVWKSEKAVAEFFSNWAADSDRPSSPIFSGPVGDLEPTAVEYDPDDTAPWSWNLEEELFQEDLTWPGYLDHLRS